MSTPTPDELRRRPLVIADTETTGLHWDREPWDIAFVRRDPDGGVTRLQVFAEVDLASAQPAGLAVGRFYERHPLGQWLAGPRMTTPPRPLDLPVAVNTRGGYVTADAAAHTVAQWTHGAVLIGAVPAFDASVFEALLRRHGLTPGWHYRTLCVETLAYGFLRGLLAAGIDLTDEAAAITTAGPPWHSAELAQACGVEAAPPEDRHTAAGDCEWALRWWDRMHTWNLPRAPA